MVRKFSESLRIVSLAYMLCFSLFLMGDSNIYITSNIDQYTAFEHEPLKGTITVTHDQSDKVDVSSFILDKKTLSVEFIQDVKISPPSPMVISYYYFHIPSQPAGLYVLPEVAVKVGGKQYRSVMSSYAVQGGTGGVTPPGATVPAQPSAAAPSVPTSPAGTVPAQPPSSPPNTPPVPATASLSPASPAPASSSLTVTAPSSTPVLKLEVSIEGTKPFYPGQRLNFVYRYFYNASIDLTKEQLPLLDAAGFLKIGDEEQKTYAQNNLTVSEVIQTVQAINPGDYRFGPSIIEGYAYTQGAGGQHIFTSGKLSSEAPAVTVTVTSFSEKDKPISFNGAIGEYKFNVALSSSPDIQVGDEITLSIDITGKGELGGVKLPEMCCQPGFSGFYVQSGLPPVGTIKGDTKNFVVRLRPLNEAVKEIPPIEFSSFDPETSKYIVLHSKPIPITVKPSKGMPIQNLDQLAPHSGHSLSVTGPTSHTKPIEIEGVFALTATDLYNKYFGTWWVLAIIPFGIALLIYQFSLLIFLERMRQEAKRRTSSNLYREALDEEKGSSRYFELINKSLKLRLNEAGLIPSPDVSAEELSAEGLPGEVRAFLCDIEERRFAGKGELLLNEIAAKAQELFEKIKPLMPNREENDLQISL